MRYSSVFLESIGYQLAPVVVTSSELEERLEPVYAKLRIPEGQFEALTGIAERRWWEPGYTLTEGALCAARKALANSPLTAGDLDMVIYGGVCREQFEPATACHVAAGLGVKEDALVFDVSNACLGVMNGIIDVANRIELGQVKAGMVVSCETAREINEITIDRLNRDPSMEHLTLSLATLTGGSGAVAVIVTDGSFRNEDQPRLLGGKTLAAPQHFGLCRWGIELHGAVTSAFQQFARTDAASVLRFGVELGSKTWRAFLDGLNWQQHQVDKVICHQVGGSHRETILSTLGLQPSQDFSTFPYLGNIGTVSLPLTAAIAVERGHLEQGDHVGFLGIGSGLNCMMLGWEWQ